MTPGKRNSENLAKARAIREAAREFVFIDPRVGTGDDWLSSTAARAIILSDIYVSLEREELFPLLRTASGNLNSIVQGEALLVSATQSGSKPKSAKRLNKEATHYALSVVNQMIWSVWDEAEKLPEQLLGNDGLGESAIERGASAQELLRVPLFSIDDKVHRDRLCRLEEAWDRDIETYRFFKNWYRCLIHGDIPIWDYWEKIVSAKGWFGGPKGLRNVINEITARYELEARIQKLEETMYSYSTRLDVGGNYPPLNMQIEEVISRQITVVWTSVEELKSELKKASPEKARVIRGVEKLGRALEAILSWTAQKADLSVDTLIKWGIPAGAAGLMANPKLLADVVDAAKTWLAFLP